MRDIQNHAFSLIELLVVISIVALLISVLLPVLGQVRDAARTTVCMTNQRQIGMGVYMYANDNSDFAPPSFNGEYTHGNIAAAQGVGILVAPPVNYYDLPGIGGTSYITVRETFFCPSQVVVEPLKPPENWGRWRVGPNTGNVSGIIGYHWYFFPEDDPVSPTRARDFKNDRITHSPNHFLLTDYGQQSWVSTTGWAPSHDNVINVLYLDGRVESVSLQEANQFSFSDYWRWLTGK